MNVFVKLWKFASNNRLIASIISGIVLFIISSISYKPLKDIIYKLLFYPIQLYLPYVILLFIIMIVLLIKNIKLRKKIDNLTHVNSDKNKSIRDKFKIFFDDHMNLPWLIKYHYLSRNIEDAVPYCITCHVPLVSINYFNQGCKVCNQIYNFDPNYDSYKEKILYKILSCVNTGNWQKNKIDYANFLKSNNKTP